MANLHDKSGYLSLDTIAAVATEVGGAISVIRVSGPEAFSILSQITQSPKSMLSEPRKLCRAILFSEHNEPMDDVLFARFVLPQSYTGENLVEFHLHGGSFTTQRVLETLIAFGARQALPGEFSFRAVRNGKMSLFQAQAVADLIAATNSGAVHLALEKISGAPNHLLSEISEGLRKMAVLGEVGIDFSDQDIDEVSLPVLKKRLEKLAHTLQLLYQSYHRGIRIQEGIRVAFIGLPNAGKSSFFNALLGENRSIVSEHAGTTRDVVHEKLTLRGKTKTVTLRLEDTAGLRETENPVEKMGIDRTLESAQKAELILFLVDPNTPMELIEAQWKELNRSQSFENKTVGILTKSDLFSQEKLAALTDQLKSLKIQSWVITSSVLGKGISDASDQIISMCENLVHRNSGEVLLTRIDHFQAVEESLEHLERASAAPELDLFAADLRQALHSLGPLIGETLPDDILGKIFSDFCIGK